MIERLTIVRVANGWVARAGDSITPDEFVHVYTDPLELAAHVKRWAEAQIIKFSGKPASEA